MQPAAFRCPPPPKLIATTDTSLLPRERRLTLVMSVCTARKSTAIWVPGTARAYSIIPSISASSTPQRAKTAKGISSTVTLPSHSCVSEDSASRRRQSSESVLRSRQFSTIKRMSAPASSNFAASRSTVPDVLPWRKKPESVASAVYKQVATAGVTSQPACSAKARTCCPTAAKRGSTHAVPSMP
ncbi:MAG: hypothetical protein DDT39_00403 [Firmicutes bacterium]|nr:hypothetical protein [candidate division NPL-UPA2 bacterium]